MIASGIIGLICVATDVLYWKPIKVGTNIDVPSIRNKLRPEWRHIRISWQIAKIEMFAF